MDILEFSAVPKRAGGDSTEGVGNHVWDLSQKLTESGYSVSIAAHNVKSWSADSSEVNKVEIFGVSIFQMIVSACLVFTSMSWWSMYWKNFKDLDKIYMMKYAAYGIFVNYIFRTIDNEPDIVHIHHISFKYPFVRHEIKSQFGENSVPILASEHGFHDLMFYDQSPARKNLVRNGIKDCKNIIYNTDQTKKEAIDIFGEVATSGNIWTGINGVNVEKFSLRKCNRSVPDKGHKTRLLYVGRLEKRKGILDFVSALHKLDRDDICVEVIGSGNESILEDLPEEYKRNLIYDQYVEDLGSRYNAADLMISPTHHEDFGLTFIESMACGTPVIGTTGVPTEVIPNDGSVGYRAKVAEPTRLAKLIEKAITTEWDSNTIREHAESFSWENKILEYHQILYRVSKSYE